MADKPQSSGSEVAPRRFGDFFERFDFPDMSRLFERRWPELLADDRIRVEEEIKDDVLHIRAEVPGIDPERDAEVSVREGVLTIKVERRKEERKEEDEGMVRSEFRYGSFYRSVPLPKGVDSSKVNASYRDGILEVTVPVPETAEGESKRIEIARSAS